MSDDSSVMVRRDTIAAILTLGMILSFDIWLRW